MLLSLSIATCFAPDYTTFTVLRTINGLNFPALFQIPFILCLEIMAPAHRTMAGMMICVFFAAALMSLAGLAYIFNSWFQLELVTAFPFLVLLSYWWIVPESPRWLISQGRTNEAKMVMISVAKWNRKQIDENFFKELHQLADQTEAKTNNQASFWVMLKNYPTTRKNFILITFNWLANAVAYNGLSYYSAKLRVAPQLGFFISAVVEVPSYFIGWYLMDRIGRRWLLLGTMVLGGLSCISCSFVPSSKCVTGSTKKTC